MSTSNDLIKMLVDIAEKEVGVREEEGNNNIGIEIQEYQKATWLVPGPWPWCSAFVCWTLREWLKIPDVKKYLNLADTKASDKWRCKDAAAFGWEKWAKARGLEVFPETALAKMGDIVIFDFSHVGIVSADQKSLKSDIKTIEGNTNGKGERDSVSGDGVWKKSRQPSLTKCYVRLL